MYDSNLACVKQSDHLEIAQKMASEIIERYEPLAQNEAVSTILKLVKQRRLEMIDETEKKNAFLKDSMNGL